MKSLNLLAKSFGFLALAAFGLVACAEPDTAQTAPAPGAPMTQNEFPADQAVNADEAADRVENALENDAELAQFDLDADEEGDAIVLAGMVDQAEQRARAEDLATQAAPEFTIVNRIDVR